MEHKMKQDSLEKSQSDLKKLRRKSQGKNANKYENKESEVSRTQTCMQMGCGTQHSEAFARLGDTETFRCSQCQLSRGDCLFIPVSL